MSDGVIITIVICVTIILVSLISRRKEKWQYGRKSLLLFNNQVINAMLDNPELAMYANMAYLSSKDDKGVNQISTILANRKINLACIQLDPGDNYVDPATGIQFDTTTDRAIFKYSIVSIE